jgi:hypothetical protein
VNLDDKHLACAIRAASKPRAWPLRDAGQPQESYDPLICEVSAHFQRDIYGLGGQHNGIVSVHEKRTVILRECCPDFFTTLASMDRRRGLVPDSELAVVDDKIQQQLLSVSQGHGGDLLTRCSTCVSSAVCHSRDICTSLLGSHCCSG